jgi:hypothetical protein
MRLIAFVLLLVVAVPAAAYESLLGPAPGIESDKLAITLTNKAGDTLSLWGRTIMKRRDYYAIMTEFRLAGGQKFGLTMPTYRIDENDELETQWMQDHGDRYGEKWGDVDETRIWWLVWGDPKNAMKKSTVGHKWLTGETIVISYTAADGTARTASFALTGAREAVVAATGLKIND